MYLLHLFNLIVDFKTNITSRPKISKNYYFKKKKWNFIKLDKFYLLLDIIYFYLIHNIFYIYSTKNFNMRTKVRIQQTSWSFYKDLFLKNTLGFNLNHYFSGFNFLWNGLKYWLLGLLLGLSSFYYLTYIRLLPFNKVMLEWLLITMFLYWVMSGFVFFIKKYQYSKYTSVIQRFWKRTYILFWLIESGVLLVFFLYNLNCTRRTSLYVWPN